MSPTRLWVLVASFLMLHSHASMFPFESSNSSNRTFVVPNLTQVRDILTHLQGPIISTVISRTAFDVEPELYSKNGKRLISFIHKIEAGHPERFAYGSLEYPFTLPTPPPDIATPRKPFPAGTFHQDTFTPNPKLVDFYLSSLLPFIGIANVATGEASAFFHLSNHTTVTDAAAKFTLDAQLLSLISQRASIGKLVAEAKYAADVATYTSLIEAKDVEAIRTLLTNRTQEQLVLTRASDASNNLATAWVSAQSASPATSTDFVGCVQRAVEELYRELIDITTEVEVQYLLGRFS